jgi:APA family basic amino acid/polyamine antiporter
MTTQEGGIQTTADFVEEHELKRVLGPVQLIMLGIGCIIGAGIFVITGTAAAEHAGPAVVLSFAFAGTACLFAGLCYAEFASMIPVAGSAYTYAYATLGGFVGWFIGWNLVLEYLMAAATVAAGWSGYFGDLLKGVGIVIPAQFAHAPFEFTGAHTLAPTGAIINLPAVALVAILTTFLVVGVRESGWVNALMVVIKVTVVIMVIAFGIQYVNPDNLTPFIPPETGKEGEFGLGGILAAAGLIFFAYIGFDAVSVAAQEAKNPQRDMPIGILGSLFICTVLYMLMAFVMTGIAHYSTLNTTHPVSTAVAGIPDLAWMTPWVNVGATVGLASVVFVSLYGQSRIFYSMSRDGFLPKLFSRVHPKFRTPHLGTILTGAVAATFAALFPLSVLGELVSIGTLVAFAVVCLGVLILRIRMPKAKRPFRTPFVWIVAPLGIAACGAMIYNLPVDTWWRLGIWTGVGLLIYFVYGVWHAKKPKWHIEQEP